MGDFIGSIKMFAGEYAPDGWMFCQGQTLSINKYPQLYAVIENTYGGDGAKTFSLPDLSCRLPIGSGYPEYFDSLYLGKVGGSENIVIPQDKFHVDTPALTVNGTIRIRVADGVANNTNAVNNALGKQTGNDPGKTSSPFIYQENPHFNENNRMNEKAVDFQLKTENFNNTYKKDIELRHMPPYTAINFIIAITGEFPKNDKK